MCLCYTVLIERLGSEIPNFSEVHAMIKSLSNMLNEGSMEIRYQAKEAINIMRVNITTKSGFNRLLIKSNLTERQI